MFYYILNKKKLSSQICYKILQIKSQIKIFYINLINDLFFYLKYNKTYFNKISFKILK